MSTIGFIGLGNMGLPMATNLVKAGHEVQGFDMVPDVIAAAKQAGILTCASAADAVDGADIIITMLPNGEIMLSVLADCIQSARKGAVFMDCSTVDVDSSKRAHATAKEHGIGSVDAPVSGGISGAAAGTLTFMVGGSDEDVKAVQPVLEIMGGRHVHCGGAGMGQAAKICNNMLLAITMIGASEAFSLGKKLGLEDQALFDVISTSSGHCWSVNTYCPVPGVGPDSPANNGYKPGFATSLMVKDAGLAQDAAGSVGQFTPLGFHALQLYKNFAEAGGGETDFSGIIQYLADQKRG